MAQAFPKRLGRQALYEYAIRALGRRSFTEKELRVRLERRASEPADVEEVMARLREVGYLDDSRVAESHSQFRRDYEGLGRQRILRELTRRGVEESVAEEAVDEVYAETDELELIRQHLRRRLGDDYGKTSVDDPKRLASLYRALVRAGFPSDKIVVALQEISTNRDWFDTVEQNYLTGDEEVLD